ncbi:hypothetical protein N9181_00045 [bacterium]|nr:hypothetical protein [bacterium]
MKISVTTSSQNGWMRTAQSMTTGLRTADKSVFSMIREEKGVFQPKSGSEHRLFLLQQRHG